MRDPTFWKLGGIFACRGLSYSVAGRGVLKLKCDQQVVKKTLGKDHTNHALSGSGPRILRRWSKGAQPHHRQITSGTMRSKEEQGQVEERKCLKGKDRAD